MKIFNRSKLIRIGLIVFVLFVAGYLMVKYLLHTGRSSKATGEAITMSFSPPSVTVAANQEFVETVKIKPSIDVSLRGYVIKFSFPKESVQLKKIKYKIGVASPGMGDTDANLAQINSLGIVKLQGDIQTAIGEIVTTSSTSDLVELTFGALNTTPTKIEIVPTDTEFYITNPDYSLSMIPIAGAVQLNVNSPEVTVTSILSPTPSPTNIPGGGVQLNLKIKFQGIAKKPEAGRDKIGVTVTIGKGNSKQKVTNMMFVADNDGTWKPNTPMSFDKIAPGSDYYILVKGGKHLQKKVCQDNPSETSPGTYHCDQGKITLNPGNNVLDFSKIIFLAGDLPEQDGIVNSYDTSLVRNNLGKNDSEAVRLADINLDGTVDTQDYSLIISALSVRSDEGDSGDATVSNATATTAPTAPIPTSTTVPGNPTSTPAPTITTAAGQGATGDLLRDGSTYPVYTSVSFIGCTSTVVSPVHFLSLSLLGQTTDYVNAPLTYQVTRPLLVGSVNVNDLLAQDLHRNDTTVTFGTTANLGVKTNGIVTDYLKNLNSANFYSMSWCTASQGCLGVYDQELMNKKFVYVTSIRVCGP